MIDKNENSFCKKICEFLNYYTNIHNYGGASRYIKISNEYVYPVNPYIFIRKI